MNKSENEYCPEKDITMGRICLKSKERNFIRKLKKK
jgi:hypothetical protein